MPGLTTAIPKEWYFFIFHCCALHPCVFMLYGIQINKLHSCSPIYNMVIGNFYNIHGLILISINYTLLTSESHHIKEHVKMSHSAQILEQYIKTIKINSRYKKKTDSKQVSNVSHFAIVL